MISRCICTIVLLMLSCTTHASSLLVWGDSLSAGYGLRQEQAWPTLLQTRLQQKGFTLPVVNGSVSGETSAGGRSRLPEALARNKPAIVILELGANDGLRGLDLAQMENNLREMIRLSEAAGARVLLIGMRMPPNLGPAYTRRFAAVYQRIAADTHTPLLPFLLEGLEQNRDFQADQMHPVAAAQAHLLDTVWNALTPLLKQVIR